MLVPTGNEQLLRRILLNTSQNIVCYQESWISNYQTIILTKAPKTTRCGDLNQVEISEVLNFFMFPTGEPEGTDQLEQTPKRAFINRIAEIPTAIGGALPACELQI